jgi:hypothetical protein
MDLDWLTFWSNEYNLRRHLQDANNLDGLEREWRALCDPRAYVQCLRKIAAARNKASTHYEVVELIARTKAQDPQAPWIHDETVALYRANRSHNVLLQALQRFTAEQKRVRQDGVTSNADQTSRNWTKDLKAETRRKSDEIRRLWGLRQALFQAMQVQAQGEDQQSGQDEDSAQEEQLAQDWCSAQDHLQAQSRPNTRSEAEFNAAGPVDERTTADDEDEEDPEPIDGSGENLEPQPSRREKRSREQDDEGARSDHSDAITRPQKKSRRLTHRRPRPMSAEDAPEKIPANDVPSGDPPPPEPEVEVERDPEEEFETRWRDFLAEVDDPDKPKWEKLYLRAQELFKHTPNPWMPDPGEDSIDDREELEKLVNEQLEEALDQEWQEHMDRIRANENNLYLQGELQYAELQRPVLMRMFREGQAPPWPPAPRTTAAEDIAAGLGPHEERAGWGPWQFFQEIARGAQGSAALWTSARFGDHGMIGEVCFHLDVQQGLCQACPLMLKDVKSQDSKVWTC